MCSSFYRSFEERHRGSVDDIKSRLEFYLPFLSLLKEAYPDGMVGDIGCGRGEWLEILNDNEINNIGVDLDDGMLARAQEANLNVKKMDCLQFLQQQEDESLIALTGFHIAEHLPFDVLQELVEQAARVLKPGGLLILETPNPENLSVGACSFYMDPTHNHPLPPPLLEFLPVYYGFKRAITVRLQEKSWLKEENAVVRLVDVIKGVSPDYSIVAQKEGDDTCLAAFDELFEKQYGLTLDMLSERYDEIIVQQRNEYEGKLAQASLAFTQQINTLSLNIQELQKDITKLNHTTDYNQQLQDYITELSHSIESNSQLQKRIADMEQAIEHNRQLHTEFNSQLQKHIIDMEQVLEHNRQLQLQSIDLKSSRKWRVTAPLRWLSHQCHLLNQEGFSVRGKKAIKKILRKVISLLLVFFHKHLGVKVYLFRILRRMGCYKLLQRLFHRLMIVPSDVAIISSTRLSDVNTIEMRSRALSIYEKLKNKNTEK